MTHACAPFTVLADGLRMGESPRWHAGRLWLSDWGARQLLAVNADGSTEVVRDMPTAPFSFDWLPDGRMLVISRGGRVEAMHTDGSVQPYADVSAVDDKPWNEIVTDGRGFAFVNGIGFEFPGGVPSTGQIAVIAPDGSTRRVADGLQFPNGMAVTADGSTLVVAESYAHCLTAFDIGSDGSLSGRRVWADLGDAAPDGICLDAGGAAWYADVPHRRCVRVAQGGRVLATLDADRGCFACMLGGEAGSMLFAVAAKWPDAFQPGSDPSGQVLTAVVTAPGAGWPARS